MAGRVEFSRNLLGEAEKCYDCVYFEYYTRGSLKKLREDG